MAKENPNPTLSKAIQEAVAQAMKAPPVPSVWDKLDVPIEHTGRAITLPGEPENMPLDKAIAALQRRKADDEQEYRVHEIFDAYAHDAAVAFIKAMQKLYGFASFETEVIQTFFGKMKKPPAMLSVRVGHKPEEVVQCPMGKFKLPGVDDPIETTIYDFQDGKGPVFLIHGEIKKKDRHVVLELATMTRRILATESIYRGKAIRLGVNDDGQLMQDSPPTFMDVSDTSAADLIFDDDVQSQIDTNILVPLRETALCRQHGIPLKRGILLEGRYGTGKSLTARLAAREAELNGWTFILLDKVQGLRVALEFATRYAPAVVFAEDIDRTASERDDATNDLINIIDGVATKGVEIMTILTTNHVENLDRVILRPGRLDAVISIRAPGPEAVQRLIRHYARDLVDAKADLSEAAEALKGQIPASIRECVERAKLGMIGRRANKLSDGDLVTAANTMKNHLALLNPKDAEQSNAEKLAKSLHSVVNNGFDARLDKMANDIERIWNHVS